MSKRDRAKPVQVEHKPEAGPTVVVEVPGRAPVEVQADNEAVAAVINELAMNPGVNYEVVVREAAAKIATLEAEVSRLQAAQPPVHVVRAFERGARAERARVLEQGRIELLSWPNGTPERRALEALRKALQDERLPLPAYTTGGA